MCNPEKNNKEVVKKQILAIDGVNYDVTDFLPRHPGGKVLSYYLNQDATDVFQAMHYHSKRAKLVLKTLPKVSVTDSMKIPKDGDKPFVQDFRKLVDDWDNKGYFGVNYPLLAYRLFEIFAFVWLSFTIFGARDLITSSLIRIPMASFVAGVAWTRCGWLQHDSGHCAVTGSTKLDHTIQLFVEGLVKGGSASWWRNRHNKHHAKCNVQGKDTDLQTYPFLSWDINIAKKLPKKYIVIQHLTFLPLLGLYVPLFFFTTKLFMFRKKKNIEAVVSLAHYALFCTALSQNYGGNVGEIFSYFFLGYIVQGLYLGFCFSLSHFAMPQIPEGTDDQDWATNAVMTTLNTNPTPFLSWLTGHLNLQVEHHLCPQMPTENLLKIKPDVEALCKKHDVKYNSVTFWEASKFTIGKLKTVANQRKLIEEICESG